MGERYAAGMALFFVRAGIKRTHRCAAWLFSPGTGLPSQTPVVWGMGNASRQRPGLTVRGFSYCQ